MLKYDFLQVRADRVIALNDIIQQTSGVNLLPY